MRSSSARGSKPPSKLSRSERETVIRKADDEDVWTITSHSPTFANLMKRRGHKGVKLGYDGLEWVVEARVVSIRGKKRVKKVSNVQNGPHSGINEE